jgi:hypothetical protein
MRYTINFHANIRYIRHDVRSNYSGTKLKGIVALCKTHFTYLSGGDLVLTSEYFVLCILVADTQ